MTSLQKIDLLLTQQLTDLELVIRQSKFEEQFKFVLGPSMGFDHIDRLSYPGIYMFHIKVDRQILLSDWLSNFQKEWENELYRKVAVPSVKTKRLKTHTEATEWLPLYIGKSKCISKRILEHLKLKLKQPTTALKLLERENLYGYEFSVSTIRVDVKNYDLIMPAFEKAFRDTYNPIIGRQ
jgi:hypothetical protein